MPELWLILSYLALGLFVGFFAGLLGVGGGAIMVPVLTSLFLAQNFPHEHVVHIALASSMAAIIFTSISSVWSQHKRQAVIWPIVFKITPGIVVGAFVMAYFVTYIPTKPLAIVFAVFMALISVQMILNKKPKPSRQLPSMLGMSVVGSVIGSLSALIAIGGGSLTVPFLTWCNVPMKKAIASSSGVGFFIAITAGVGYFMGGKDQAGLPEFSSGYIYWPAVLLISIVSVFIAPFGVKMAHKLPVSMLKKVFALLMMGLSIKMLMTI